MLFLSCKSHPKYSFTMMTLIWTAYTRGCWELLYSILDQILSSVISRNCSGLRSSRIDVVSMYLLRICSIETIRCFILKPYGLNLLSWDCNLLDHLAKLGTICLTREKRDERKDKTVPFQYVLHLMPTRPIQAGLLAIGTDSIPSFLWVF